MQVAEPTAGAAYTLSANVENSALTNSVAYSLIGMVVGFILYEAVKLAFVLLLQPKKRRFRKRT